MVIAGMRRHLIKLLRCMAKLCGGVPKQSGSLWHAYRRKWATERKHLPNVDVAAAGGWSALASLQTCYQMADSQTMFKVVSSPARLSEALER